MPPSPRKGFTLIELLVVIAIIAILAVVVILTLNPAELLRQSRDSNRISDLATLSEALSLYSADVGGSIGTSSVVYSSIADPIATTTSGDQCQGLSLPSLPVAYSYHCAASSTNRNIDSTGWIPLNFGKISSGAPLGNLPIDPASASSSRLYYTYASNGNQYELTASMESVKYKVGGSNDVITGDGGTLDTVYEKGTQLGLEPLDYGDTTLQGLWTLDEGTGTVAYDYSGNNATGSWTGTMTGTSGYYSGGKVGSWSGTFNGTNNLIQIPYTAALAPTTGISFGGWFNTANVGTASQAILSKTEAGGYAMYLNVTGVGSCTTMLCGYVYVNGGYRSVGYADSGLSSNTWYQAFFTYSGSIEDLYLNGALVSSTPLSGSIVYNNSNALCIGGEPGASTCNGGGYFNGSLDDIRVYNRALSAAEVQSLYAGGK